MRLQVRRSQKRLRTLSGTLLLIGTASLPLILSLATIVLRADTGTCGGATTTLPFLDVTGNPFFCQIASAYFSGLTNGTSATTFGPFNGVTREQMAAFITRTLDQSLSRGSKRTVLNQRWNVSNIDAMFSLLPKKQGLDDYPNGVQFDGSEVWVSGDRDLYRVHASDGVYSPTAFPATDLNLHIFRGVVVTPKWVIAAHRVSASDGRLISIARANEVTPKMHSGIVGNPEGLAFDGSRVFVGSESGGISIVTIGPPSATWAKTNVSGFSQPRNVIFDGNNIWAVDYGAGTLLRLGSDGSVLQTVTVGSNPLSPAFDGANLWVPNYGSHSVSVVRASTGTVVSTLTGNGLFTPSAAAFDGERIMITNESGGSVSLFRATDLTPINVVSLGIGSQPVAVCSDGISFWIADKAGGRVIRF